MRKRRGKAHCLLCLKGCHCSWKEMEEEEVVEAFYVRTYHYSVGYPESEFSCVVALQQNWIACAYFLE